MYAVSCHHSIIVNMFKYINIYLNESKKYYFPITQSCSHSSVISSNSLTS